MPENWIEFDSFEDYAEYRKRKEIGTVIEEFCRAREERLVSQISISSYFGTTRPHLFDAPGDYIFCRNKNDFEKAQQDSIVGTFKDKKFRF